MKYRIFIYMLVCFTLLLAGCGNKEPLAPDTKEFVQNEQGSSLAKGSNVKITPWEGVETRQEITDPGKEWISEDNVWHIRGRVQVDIVESDEIRIAGTSTITWDADMDLITGDGIYTSKCLHKSSSVNGYWEGRLIGELKKFMFLGQGSAKGKHEFEGMRMTLQIHDTPPPYVVCPVSGFIIEKN